MKVVIFAKFLPVCEIFANFDLENESQCPAVEERDFCNSTENVRFHIGEFLRILATWQHTFTQMVTHIPRSKGDDYRQNMQSRFA